MRAGDEELLERVFAAIGTTDYLFGLVEARAIACIERDELAIGERLLRACVQGPSAGLSAWNNFAHAVTKLPPADRLNAKQAEPLLEAALSVGPANVGIFHNVACAAVAVGLSDLALRAVEGAKQHGYAELERMKTDEDLRPLFDEPRFVAAFESAAARFGIDDLDKLSVYLNIRGKRHLVHRAVVGMTFYLAGKLTEVAPRIGKLADAYTADLPVGTLAFRDAGKKLAKATATKQRKSLDAWPKRQEFLELHRRSTDGDAADYELDADGDEDDGGATVTLAFPPMRALEPDALQRDFARYALVSGAQSGHAGFDLRNRDSGGVYEGVSWDRVMLRKRFLAVQGSDWWWRAGRTPPAHWLVWLATPLVDALGGALEHAIGDARLTSADDGVVLRAARVPPLAPASDPTDCGAIPAVARALAPLRIKARGDPNITYLARWDNLPCGPYDNA